MLPIALGVFVATSAFGADSPEVASIEAVSFGYVVFAACVTLIKIAALVIGSLVVPLCYTTIVAGAVSRKTPTSTILRFRRLLDAHMPAPQTLAAVNKFVGAKGLLLPRSSVLDATLIFAPVRPATPRVRAIRR